MQAKIIADTFEKIAFSSAGRKKHCLENGDGKMTQDSAVSKSSAPENGVKSPE